jgi:hypothetical protein
MTRPTISAWKRFGGKVHGSADGRYTLCNYVIRTDTYAGDHMPGYDQRKFVTCRHCLARLNEDERR